MKIEAATSRRFAPRAIPNAAVRFFYYKALKSIYSPIRRLTDGMGRGVTRPLWSVRGNYYEKMSLLPSGLEIRVIELVPGKSQVLDDVFNYSARNVAMMFSKGDELLGMKRV